MSHQSPKRTCDPTWNQWLYNIMPQVIPFLVGVPDPDECITKTLGRDAHGILQTSTGGKRAVDAFIVQRRKYWQDKAGIWKFEDTECVQFVDRTTDDDDDPFLLYPCERMLVVYGPREVASYSGGHFDGIDGPYVYQDGTSMTVADHIRHFTSNYVVSAFVITL